MPRIGDLQRKKLKKQLLLKDNAKAAALAAGISPSAARNATRLKCVIDCQDEIMQEFKAEDIVKQVTDRLLFEMKHAKNASDRIAAATWLGRKEAMFTDRMETTHKFPTSDENGNVITNVFNRISLTPTTNN